MDTWRLILLWILGIIIGFFWLLWYTNDRSIDYWNFEESMTIESYCNTIFEMYDYDLEDENYEHESCRIRVNQKEICLEEERIFWEWEGLERCLSDLEFNKHNVLNLIK